MSNYANKLAELKAQDGHLLKEVGDQWRTPDELYWGIYSQYGPFVLDLFSDGENAKSPQYYTAETNALSQDWTTDLNGGKAFANPPYSRASYEDGEAVTGMRNIIKKTMDEREKGAKSVFLIKSATSEVWWPEEADAIRFIRGRIAFKTPSWFKPVNDKQVASGAGFAAAIAIFDKDFQGQQFGYVSRDELYRHGEILMSQFGLKGDAA